MVSLTKVVLFLFLGAFSLPALLLMFSHKKLSLMSIFRFISGASVLMGVIGFIGAALVSVTDIKILERKEWPIGASSGALYLSNVNYVVPHSSSSRIQIYSDTLEYIRGWGIDAGAGAFILRAAENDTFYVFTARGNMKYLYDTSGHMISSEKYSEPYPWDKRDDLVSVNIPTPIYLWPLINPVNAWLTIVFGLGFVFFGAMFCTLLDKVKLRVSRKNTLG